MTILLEDAEDCLTKITAELRAPRGRFRPDGRRDRAAGCSKPSGPRREGRGEDVRDHPYGNLWKRSSAATRKPHKNVSRRQANNKGGRHWSRSRGSRSRVDHNGPAACRAPRTTWTGRDVSPAFPKSRSGDRPMKSWCKPWKTRLRNTGSGRGQHGGNPHAISCRKAALTA